MVKVYLYSSVRNFVIAGTDENGENWYMTNINQFTVSYSDGNNPGNEFALKLSFIGQVIYSHASSESSSLM